MEKLKKTAKVLDRFAKIFKVIFIAAAIFLFAGLIITSVYYLAIRDDDAVAVLVGGDLHLTLGNVRLNLDHLVPGSTRPLVPVAVMMLTNALMLAIAAVEAGILHRILAPMAEGRPFDSAVSENLGKLGWLTLVQAAVYSVAEFLIFSMELRLFEFGYFLNPEYVKSYTVDFRLEISRFLIPAALFLLSWIFHYGEELQRQSDETL